jgi:hypothetical protein
MHIMHPGALYIHFFANICIISVYLMLLVSWIVDDWVWSRRSQLSIGMSSHRVVYSWDTVSFQSHNKTHPNSQQLGYGLNSLTSISQWDHTSRVNRWVHFRSNVESQGAFSE